MKQSPLTPNFLLISCTGHESVYQFNYCGVFFDGAERLGMNRSDFHLPHPSAVHGWVFLCKTKIFFKAGLAWKPVPPVPQPTILGVLPAGKWTGMQYLGHCHVTMMSYSMGRHIIVRTHVESLTSQI